MGGSTSKSRMRMALNTWMSKYKTEDKEEQEEDLSLLWSGLGYSEICLDEGRNFCTVRPLTSKYPSPNNGAWNSKS